MKLLNKYRCLDIFRGVLPKIGLMPSSKVVIFSCFILFYASNTKPVLGQTLLHASSMIHYDFISQQGPGYDITFFVKGNVGFRLTHVSDFSFLETSDRVDNTVLESRFKGDLYIPMLIKTLDYKTFNEGPQKIFDFITGYLGVGYNELDIILDQTVYSAESDTLTSEERTGGAKTSLTAFSFGIYGGEDIVVIDGRIQLLKGTIEASDDLNKEKEYQKWRMVLAIGIGF